MARMSLFNQQLTLYRATGEGYWDGNEYVADPEEEVPVEGNIQPYREGVNNFLTPAGFRATSAIMVYVTGTTGDEIRAENDRLSSVADEIEYRGSRYKCIDLQDWTGQTTNGRSLIPNHMLGLFYQKDKITEVTP